MARGDNPRSPRDVIGGTSNEVSIVIGGGFHETLVERIVDAAVVTTANVTITFSDDIRIVDIIVIFIVVVVVVVVVINVTFVLICLVGFSFIVLVIKRVWKIKMGG